jgi:hypothetical protein
MAQTRLHFPQEIEFSLHKKPFQSSFRDPVLSQDHIGRPGFV